jgi:hypothetical protein
MRFRKDHEDDAQVVLVTKLRKLEFLFVCSNIITHFCLLIDDGYA